MESDDARLLKWLRGVVEVDMAQAARVRIPYLASKDVRVG